VGYKVIIEELKSHLSHCIRGVRDAKDWNDHLVWEARASLIEEMIPLRATILDQDRESKKYQKLEKEE